MDRGKGEERKRGKEGEERVIDLEADVETGDLILHVAKDDLVRLKVAEDGQKSLLSPVGRGDRFNEQEPVTANPHSLKKTNLLCIIHVHARI